jgi:ComF family protein
MPGTWVDQVLDALFPARCALCDQASAGLPVCRGCETDLPWLARSCQRCAIPLPPAGEDSGVCGRCPPGLLAYREVRAPLAYEYPVDQLVLAAKFGRQIGAAQALGELLARRIGPAHAAPDLVLPVPLHWKRQAERGFNQAEEIARVVCRRLGWRLDTRVLQRVRKTAEQAQLGAAGRAGNLRDAFAARPLRGGIRVLIIDDVLTTGATAAAVIQALLRNGDVDATFWAAARTAAPGLPA